MTTLTINSSLPLLKEKMVADYSKAGFPEEMINKFADSISFSFGKKYIKVKFEHSVWGFLVNTSSDKKFSYGTILKPASYASPARNFSRGNVLCLENVAVRWTSA